MTDLTFAQALQNLTTLRHHFDEVMSQDLINFDMESYLGTSDFGRNTPMTAHNEYQETIKRGEPCGASCCIVGVAAFSSLPEFIPQAGEGWDDYEERLFTGGRFAIYDFLFSGQHPNVKPAALYRLDKAIEKMSKLMAMKTDDEVRWDVFRYWCNDMVEEIEYGTFYPQEIQTLINIWEEDNA